MAKLFGVAFSSPAVIPLLIDNSRFMVHTYSGNDQDYKDYLSVREQRDKIVLVSSVRRLVKAADLDTDHQVRVFLIFDRSEILSNIEGCEILDAEKSGLNWTIKPDKITKGDFNTLLEEAAATDASFLVPEDINQIATLFKPTLLDFIQQVLASIPKERLPRDESEESDESEDEYNSATFDEEFVKETFGWICGISHARRWIVRYKKKLINFGADQELVLDLYRFCAEGQEAKNLWKAYHAMREGVELGTAALLFAAHPIDLKKCARMYPPEEDREYIAVPNLQETEEEDDFNEEA